MYALVGLPGETKEDFKETLECIRACNTNNVFLSILYPYPGTDIYKTAVDKKLLDTDKMGVKYERVVSYLSLPDFSRFQIKLAQITAYYKIYSKKWSIFKIILYTAIFNMPTKKSAVILRVFRKISNNLSEKYLSRFPFM
jgi:radical SAM superfamily enzyme YgiQ (UPF0313 family)